MRSRTLEENSLSRWQVFMVRWGYRATPYTSDAWMRHYKWINVGAKGLLDTSLAAWWSGWFSDDNRLVQLWRSQVRNRNQERENHMGQENPEKYNLPEEVEDEDANEADLASAIDAIETGASAPPDDPESRWFDGSDEGRID